MECFPETFQVKGQCIQLALFDYWALVCVSYLTYLYAI